VACGVSLSNASRASQSSYDGLQRALEPRLLCGSHVSKRNPCWPHWRLTERQKVACVLTVAQTDELIPIISI